MPSAANRAAILADMPNPGGTAGQASQSSTSVPSAASVDAPTTTPAPTSAPSKTKAVLGDLLNPQNAGQALPDALGLGQNGA